MRRFTKKFIVPFVDRCGYSNLCEIGSQGGSILFHDVHWPYARRDMYYDPDNIPVEFQQPRAKRGIIRGQVALASSEGQGKNADLWNALNEGGPRNGVLTAIEDFMNEHPSSYEFYRLHREWGLGVLTRKGQQPKGLSKLKLKGVWYNFISPIKIRLGLYDR